MRTRLKLFNSSGSTRLLLIVERLIQRGGFWMGDNSFLFSLDIEGMNFFDNDLNYVSLTTRNRCFCR